MLCMFGAYCVTVITGQVERLNRSTGDILDLTVTKKNQRKGEATYCAHLLRFGGMNYRWSVMLTFQEEQAEVSVVL